MDAFFWQFLPFCETDEFEAVNRFKIDHDDEGWQRCKLVQNCANGPALLPQNRGDKQNGDPPKGGLKFIQHSIH